MIRLAPLALATALRAVALLSVALLAVALLAVPAGAQLSQRDLARAGARPTPGVRLPTALVFTDLHGGRIGLGTVADGRPLVLLFADYTCRHVCGPGLALTAGALADTGLIAGRDYRLAVIGLDAKDPPAAAAAMARQIADAPVARATTLLRGDAATVAAATSALGYTTVYDATADQYAHDAAVYVFAADGRLAALLPELALRPEPLKAALAGGATPSLAEQVAHLCYGLAAAHGRYGRPIVLALQFASAALALGLGLFVWRRART